MSAVTKVLVILQVVLCIAFSMTAVAFTARTNNWRALAEDYRTEAQIANAQQRNAMAAHAAEIASARDTINDNLDRIKDLDDELNRVTRDLAEKEGEIAQLTTDKRRSEALAQRLTNELGIAQSARDAIQQQRQQFESRNIELERRNIDLNERVNELTMQVTVLNQKHRQQAQQIHILREQTNKQAEQLGVAPDVTAARFVDTSAPPNVRPADSGEAMPRISGHVQFVDGDLVTLSVGSADRVRKGLVFVIFRGNQYIGDVEISDIEPNLSTGRLIRSAPGIHPETGDQADDEHHFAQPR